MERPTILSLQQTVLPAGTFLLMRPVAILQHDKTQRPGMLLRCLDEWGVPSSTFMPEEGERVPRRARDFAGIVLLGSNRSVNDALPWIDAELVLLRDATAAGV